MTYDSALEYLFSQLPMFSRGGAAAYKPGLDTTLALDEYFHHPHRKYKTIHVAGTNGKGSTSHTLASVLQAAGYKTGLYTSPHLVDFRERMRVNGEMIPKEKVVEFVEKWKNCGYDGHPSFFELTMMMAFDWFAEEQVDYAVIEVGMGGRLDSTNVITPELCVITNISNDHSQFLGTTLPAIAREKAGIIKAGIPVVIGEAEGDVRKVFEEKIAETGTKGVFAEDAPLLSDIRESKDGGWEAESPFEHLCFPLGGDYQKKNLETAVRAIHEMRNAGIEVSDDAVVKGIAEVVNATHLMGRWMIVSKNPLTIADTGHNTGGLQYNMEQLRRIRSLDRRTVDQEGRTLRMVIGFVADKAIDKILELLPKDAIYYLTNAAIPRALPVAELKKLFDAAGFESRAYPDVTSAYASALSDGSGKSGRSSSAYASALSDGPGDIIYIGGSTFIVADFLAKC